MSAESASPKTNSLRRLDIVAQLAALREQMEEVQATLVDRLERYALTVEERQSLLSEERLLVADGASNAVLADLRQQEWALLRETALLGQEILSLVGERQSLHEARLTLLAEQHRLLDDVRSRWPWRPDRYEL